MKLTLTLKNKGKFSIYNIKGLGVDDIDPDDFGEDGLAPGAVSSNVEIVFCRVESANEIEIVSKIKIDDKEGYCSENTLIINDNILKNLPPSSA